jgi:hypothetical protein
MTQEDSINDIIDRLTEASMAFLSKRKSVTTEKGCLKEELSLKKKKKNVSEANLLQSPCDKTSLSEPKSDSGKSISHVLKKTKVKQGKQTDSNTQQVITETVKNIAESALLMQFPVDNGLNLGSTCLHP